HHVQAIGARGGEGAVGDRDVCGLRLVQHHVELGPPALGGHAIGERDGGGGAEDRRRAGLVGHGGVRGGVRGGARPGEGDGVVPRVGDVGVAVGVGGGELDGGGGPGGGRGRGVSAV